MREAEAVIDELLAWEEHLLDLSNRGTKNRDIRPRPPETLVETAAMIQPDDATGRLTVTRIAREVPPS
jgi:hypothetical protein